ncbi:NAD-dependent epimerase/dehydratase family protein [Myxococcota bacterium]
MHKRSERRRRWLRRAPPLRAGTFPADSASSGLATGVLVTGVVGGLGRRLVRLLHRECPVVGLDRRPFPDRPKDVEHYELDLRSSRIRDLFRSGRIGAIVHLPRVLEEPDGSGDEDAASHLTGFQKLLDHAQRFSVKKLVVLSSAAVYGARPDNPQFLTEQAPLLGGGHSKHLAHWGSLDLLAQSFFWQYPGTETVIVRPAHLLGPIENAASNYLRLTLVPTLLGFDPMIQLLHVDDAASALVRALKPGVRGIFNLAGPRPCSLSEALCVLGRRQVGVPRALAQLGVANWFWRRAGDLSIPDLDFLRYVCMVDDRPARKVLEYRPAHDLRRTLEAVDEERWV